jgi:hypothetical protein
MAGERHGNGMLCVNRPLTVRTIREEITKFIVKYTNKITTHSNELTSTLLEEEELRRVKS